MATSNPQDDFQKTALRLPRDLHANLHEAAAKSGRSYNAEIVARLHASFDALPTADAAAAQELADSRAQTITAMEFLQGSLCETVVAMYPNLVPKSQRDRTIANAHRLAESLLAGVTPGDFQKSRSELLATNPALSRFLEEVESDIKRHQMREARSGRAGGTKR